MHFKITLTRQLFCVCLSLCHISEVVSSVILALGVKIRFRLRASVCASVSKVSVIVVLNAPVRLCQLQAAAISSSLSALPAAILSFPPLLHHFQLQITLLLSFTPSIPSSPVLAGGPGVGVTTELMTASGSPVKKAGRIEGWVEVGPVSESLRSATVHTASLFPEEQTLCGTHTHSDITKI